MATASPWPSTTELLTWRHVTIGLASIFLVAVAGMVWRSAYNLFFHPLAGVPGPKLAAVTNLWRFFYEIKGILPFKLKELQTDHNWPPIIRTGPDQVVIHDPSQYDVIYRVNSKFMKDRRFYEMATSGRNGGTTVTTCDKQTHASRRKDTMGQLSRQKVALLHPLVTEKLSIFLGHVQHLCESGKPVNVLAGWKCLTLDIISEYAFGQCLDALSDSNFESHMVKTLDMFVRSFQLLVSFPTFLLNFIATTGYGASIFPGAKAIHDFFKWANNCVVYFRPNKDKHCILDSLVDPNRPEKLTIPQIESEAEDILIAGSDTTALTLTYACVHLARHPDIWEQLYRDIKPVYGPVDDFPPLRALESIPLLTACIKESLRLSTPVPSYLWRTVPAEGYQFTHGNTTYNIPAGTSIGMSPWNQHYNEDIFPEPHEGKPSRWLGEDGDELDQYLVVFSKGTRGCGGLNLAWMEMYLALAAMVMRFSIVREAEPGKELVQRDQFVGLLTDRVWNIYFAPRTVEGRV